MITKGNKIIAMNTPENFDTISTPKKFIAKQAANVKAFIKYPIQFATPKAYKVIIESQKKKKRIQSDGTR